MKFYRSLHSENNEHSPTICGTCPWVVLTVTPNHSKRLCKNPSDNAPCGGAATPPQAPRR